ncbi:MAG TPA: transcription-repair coupling factor [Bacteroidales bacterium]|nr:transcription-repair coupling factor [Bacteroidales bacterium]
MLVSHELETLDLSKFVPIYQNHPHFETINQWLTAPGERISVKGLGQSAVSLLVAAQHQTGKAILLIEQDKESAAYKYDDLCRLLGEQHVLFLPSSFKRSVKSGQTENANILLRTDVSEKLSQQKHNYITVSWMDAVAEKIPSRKHLQAHTLYLSAGEKVSIQFIVEILQTYDFVRTDFVYEPGQYSVRGSIVDIFSFSNDKPYRIDMFDDEVESIRTFDLQTQLSTARLNEISIVPNLHLASLEEKIPFSDFLAEKTIIWINSKQQASQQFDDLWNAENLSEEEEKNIADNFITKAEWQAFLAQYTTIDFGFGFQEKKHLKFNTLPQPDFKKNFEIYANFLSEKKHEGYTNLILTENDTQAERIKAIFESITRNNIYTRLKTILHAGFYDTDLKLIVLTDHELFERYHKFSLRSENISSGKNHLTLKELQNLNPGDYVVHDDHGIGRFAGLHKIELNGKHQETIKLVYKDNDVLFISVHSLHRISKYKGKEGDAPNINKLGTGAWNKLKQRAKGKIKDIAKELIALYAKRRTEQGFAYSPDSYLQRSLEASFIYEDTPDQYKATEAVKADMEKPEPMDRLVCGDVGFGKTEIAIRAAFKAVADSKQVAILVPTTILALQHYKTFKKRLHDYPCNVEYISRLRKASDVKEALKNVAEGKVDILIGTHKLISKEVKFKDLGLLIIDEEQKFGVAVKEKLKQIKVNVDTLTLTATPIPRTLQFSLMGARDLSVIQTPPPNRYPIATELHTFNERIIKEAIEYETARNGQVFFIHNRVQSIKDVELMINRMCPNISTVTAHGQMDGAELEKVMLDFINEKHAVLIATTIIESGLDIANANTIIINNAHQFGLSDLHQLRGRVGRSNKKAFCYLLAPPPNMLNQEARRRLKAIEDFSELGSGFSISLQDLDIRGAGNLLGGEQSGFIAEIGYETYRKILNEAVLELRETEFKDVFNDDDELQDFDGNTHRFTLDCQIDTDLEVLIPESYIENTAERIRFYRDLDNITSEEKLEPITKELTDRFGTIPQPVLALMDIVKLRRRAMNFGMEKILLKNEKMICYFVTNQESKFYQSDEFGQVLRFVQKNQRTCAMKETNNRLSLSFAGIKSVAESLKIIENITKS